MSWLPASEMIRPSLAVWRMRNSITPSGVRAAIDIVAEMDDAPVGRPDAHDVRCDLRVHFGEQVEPAVHVADSVDDHALRAARVGKLILCHSVPA